LSGEHGGIFLKKSFFVDLTEAGMGIIKESMKQEIKQLPFMLGKLLGAVMAIIGIPAVIWIATRNPGASWREIFPYALQGIFGILIFYASSVLARHRLRVLPPSVRSQAEKNRVSIIAWKIFFGLIGLAFLSLYLMWYLS